MIITKKIGMQVGACTQGVIDGILIAINDPENYQGDINYREAITKLENSDRPDLANWLKASKISIIKAIGNYTFGGYRVQNIISGEFQYFDNLSDAKAQVVANGKEYVINQKERFSVNIDIDNPDGSVTWTPVDPFSFDQEDDYQVFNTFTGHYDYYSNLTDAKVAQNNLESIVASQVPDVQQQIISSDGTESGWINV